MDALLYIDATISLFWSADDKAYKLLLQSLLHLFLVVGFGSIHKDRNGMMQTMPLLDMVYPL